MEAGEIHRLCAASIKRVIHRYVVDCHGSGISKGQPLVVFCAVYFDPPKAPICDNQENIILVGEKPRICQVLRPGPLIQNLMDHFD